MHAEQGKQNPGLEKPRDLKKGLGRFRVLGFRVSRLPSKTIGFY